jgi:uncharacterized integral membrane protein
MYRNEQYEYPAVKHKTLGYPYRVWIFSILLTPLVITFYSMSKNDNGFLGYFFTYFAWLSIFLMLSVPAGVIYIAMFWRVAGSKLPDIQVKMLLALTGIVAICIETIIILLIFSKITSLPALIDIHFISFSGTFIISSLLFSLKEK